MRHQKNALTNLEVALLNGVAMVTFAFTLRWISNGILPPDGISSTLGQGGGVAVTSSDVAKACGYERLTTYHRRSLEKLSEYGYITAGYVSGGKRSYTLTETGLRWCMDRF